MRRPSIVSQGIAVVLAGLSWLAYVPPFSWLAEGQMRLMGSYSPMVAVLGTLIIITIPALLIDSFVQGLIGREQGDSRFADLLRTSPRAIGALVGGLVLLGVGVHDFVDSARIGDHCLPLTLASLVDGHTPPSRWVELSEYIPDPDRAMTLRDGSSEHAFIPLAVDAPGEIPVVIADCATYELSSLEIGSPLRGVLRSGGLPGEIRTAFEGAGLRTGSYWVLDVGDSPEERVVRGQIMGGLGALVFLGALVYCIRRWREL